MQMGQSSIRLREGLTRRFDSAGGPLKYSFREFLEKKRYIPKDGTWLSVNNVKTSESSHEMKWGFPRACF